jgi:hypothetical protein
MKLQWACVWEKLIDGWLLTNHQHQPPLITRSAYQENHRNTPELRGSYGAHGYGCLFCESSFIHSGQVIVVQCEGVTVVPHHYHKSTGNSLSCLYRQMLHGWLHATSREKINKQIHKGNNKTSLFHIINLARVLPPPQKQRNLLTQRGQKHHHNKEMNE